MSGNTAKLRKVALSDKYDLSVDAVYVTGIQALVRMCLLQAQRDQQAGLNTGGYVTGYRGSPLGAIDFQFTSAKGQLDEAGIVFEPALNEDLAATAIWGSQQAAIRGEGKNDGVFALWYGKGPGVDRSGDVFRHANLAGSAQKGGVLVVMGDDHAGESSTVCHQSEYALIDAQMPILSPANLTEIVDYGLHGWAMSRFSGLWVGLKCMKDYVESSGSVRLGLDRALPKIPKLKTMPEAGLNIRAGDNRFAEEARLSRYKLEAAKAYAKTNKLDRVIWPGAAPGKKSADKKIGIIASGKPFMDVVQALDDLGIDKKYGKELGLSLYKIAMVWPLEPEGVIKFAEDLDQIIVVEEKRGLIEDQLRQILYDAKNQPVIIGKRDENGKPLFAEHGTINALMVASALTERLPEMGRQRTALTRLIGSNLPEAGVMRTPYFCAGCPHNSSTRLPEGARAYAGIGCHWLAQGMDRNTDGFTHMGGEGANWIGEAPFSTREHIFQNLGDGTYNHSGLMALRAAIAAGVNMTYKILYNDAVAMTGGQSHEGGLGPVEIAAELTAIGVNRLEIVSENPSALKKLFPVGTKIHHRDRLNHIQTELAQTKGVSVLLYDQTCATEKRRKRKRGLIEEPGERVFIDPEICEGCGDCSVQSNCVAILPLETELGTKRRIDQSACNMDFSCVKGFCPSFITIKGGGLKTEKDGGAGAVPLPLMAELNEPKPALTLKTPKAITLTGVGGTGVLTIGALIGMAAHLDGKGCGLIDMAGLAQKGGSVTSHIRLAETPNEIKAIRIAPGGADLLIGGDLVVSAASQNLKLLKFDAHIIANNFQMPTADFVRDRDFKLPGQELEKRLTDAVPEGQTHLVNATDIARALLGDTIGANLFLLGATWQKGLLPLSQDAIRQAVRLNGVAVEFNLAAFDWGRLWATRPDEITKQLEAQSAENIKKPATLKALIADRQQRLNQYQNPAYGNDFVAFIETVKQDDPDPAKELSRAVCENLYKLMAYKDEYEVARLLTRKSLDAQIAQEFDGNFKHYAHLAPPFLPGRDENGRPKKRRFGPWIWPLLRLLVRFKTLRGSLADPFGWQRERRAERNMIVQYRSAIDAALKVLKARPSDKKTYRLILEIARLPEEIRGFAPIKAKALDRTQTRLNTLVETLKRPGNKTGPSKGVKTRKAAKSAA